jgi:hypothetical protein
MTPLVGELALPTAAPTKRDSAAWLWVAIIVIAIVICGVLLGAVAWIQSLQQALAAMPSTAWMGFTVLT